MLRKLQIFTGALAVVAVFGVATPKAEAGWGISWSDLNPVTWFADKVTGGKSTEIVEGAVKDIVRKPERLLLPPGTAILLDNGDEIAQIAASTNIAIVTTEVAVDVASKLPEEAVVLPVGTAVIVNGIHGVVQSNNSGTENGEASSGSAGASSTFLVKVGDKSYKNGDTITIQQGATSTATVAWNTHEGSQCVFRSNLGVKRDLAASGSFQQAVPGASYDWEMTCGYYDDNIGEGGYVTSLDAQVHFVVQNALGDAIDHSSNTAQFAIAATPQIITLGEATTLSWSIHPAFVNADGRDVKDCKLEVNDAGGWRTVGAWSYDDMKGADNIFRTEDRPKKTGTLQYALGCNYWLRRPNVIPGDEGVPGYEKTFISVQVNPATTSDAAATDAAPATLTFTATPETTVARGTDVTLSWNYTDASKLCLTGGDWTVDDVKTYGGANLVVVGDDDVKRLKPQGSFKFIDIGNNAPEITEYTFGIACWNGSANVEKSITINVTDDSGTESATATSGTSAKNLLTFSAEAVNADDIVSNTNGVLRVKRGSDVKLTWEYFYVSYQCTPSGIGFSVDDVRKTNPELVTSNNMLVPRGGSYVIRAIGNGNDNSVQTYTIECDGVEKVINIGIVDDAGSAASGNDSGDGADATGSAAGSDTTGGSSAGSATNEAGRQPLTFTVKGGTKLNGIFPVKTNEPFTLQWSTDPRNVCLPGGDWSLDDVRRTSPGLVMDRFVIGGEYTEADDALRPTGEYTITLADVGPATFELRCMKRFDWLKLSARKAIVTVTASAGGETTGTAGTTGAAGTGGTDTGTTAQQGNYITDFTVAPDAIAHDGAVTAAYTVAVPQEELRCMLSGKRDGDARAVEIQKTTFGESDYGNERTRTRTIALGQMVGDGIVHVSLACVPTSGSATADTQTRDVRVGTTAGIRQFTVDQFHLAKPGNVQLSWDTFGMKSCDVDKKVLDGRRVFITPRRFWTGDAGQHYVGEGVTQFTLTCVPEDGSAVQKKTLTVSVGNYASGQAIDGTGSASDPETVTYTNYCPTDVSSAYDRIIHFSQRLEVGGQKETVSADIPAGEYKVWLTASDSFDQRSDQDQSNERYYVEFFNAEGKVVAETDPSDDIADGDGANVATVMTMVGEGLVLNKPITLVAAVHADGGNASVNPGCIVLKRVDVPDESSETGASSAAVASGTEASGTTGTEGAVQSDNNAIVTVAAPDGAAYSEQNNQITARSGEQYTIDWRGYLNTTSQVRRNCSVEVDGTTVAGPQGEGRYVYTVPDHNTVVHVTCIKKPFLYFISREKVFTTTFVVDLPGTTEADSGAVTVVAGPVEGRDFTFAATNVVKKGDAVTFALDYSVRTDGTVCSVAGPADVNITGITKNQGGTIAQTITQATSYTMTCAKDGQSQTKQITVDASTAEVSEASTGASTTTAGSTTTDGTTTGSSASAASRSFAQTSGNDCKVRWEQNVSGNFASPQGVTQALCDTNSGTVTVRVAKDDPHYYTWSTAYYTTDGNALSQSTTVHGERDASGQWVVGAGDVVIPQSSGVNYIATYTCTRSGDGWQCGCSQDGACSEPKRGNFIWYLTGYEGGAVAR